MKKYESNKDKLYQDKWNSSYSAIPEKEVQASWDKFSGNLKFQEKARYKRIFIRIGSVAAFLIILLSTYFFLEVYKPTVTINNFSKVAKDVKLPDGTLVSLKPGSTILFKQHFRNSRDVELKGEAFFDVAKDSLKEFRVKTQFTTTLALGTSFLISEKPDLNGTKVMLYTGRVLVSVEDKTESWALIPGEIFLYEDDEIFIKKDDRNNFKDFNHVGLKHVFEFLEKRFSYKFIADATAENKKVTLRINNSDSLRQTLEVLSIITHTSYEVNSETKKVKISSKEF